MNQQPFLKQSSNMIFMNTKIKWPTRLCKKLYPSCFSFNGKLVLLALLVMLYVNRVGAQTSITLQSAIDSALKNNLSIFNQALMQTYQQKLEAAAYDIPYTNFSTEIGQFNSIYIDNKFGVLQSMAFPLVYKKQKQVQHEYFKTAVLNKSLKEAEVKKQLIETVYELYYLAQKQKILLHQDSLYIQFIEKANKRLAMGEANLLEKTTAEINSVQLNIQLNDLNNEIDLLKLKLQILMNTKQMFVVVVNNPKLTFDSKGTTVFFENNPNAKLLQQQSQLAILNSQLEKSKLWPQLNWGYSNQSIQGSGANNIFYTKLTRFSAVQLGIGLPLFYSAQSSKIAASKTLEIIALNNYQIGLQALKMEYASALKNYAVKLQTLNYFEQQALNNATIITQTANKQFEKGEINYLEWAMLINQSLAVQSQYWDAINDVNHAVIQLNYLSNK